MPAVSRDNDFPLIVLMRHHSDHELINECDFTLLEEYFEVEDEVIKHVVQNLPLQPERHLLYYSIVE